MSLASTPSFSDSSLIVTPSERKIGPVGIGFLNSRSLPESWARVDFAARRSADFDTGFATATISPSSAPSPFSMSGREMSEYVSSSYAPTNSRRSTSSATLIFGFAPRFAAGFLSLSSSFFRFVTGRSTSGGVAAGRPGPIGRPAGPVGRPAGPLGPVGRRGIPAGRMPGPPGVGRYTDGPGRPEAPLAGPIGRAGPRGPVGPMGRVAPGVAGRAIPADAPGAVGLAGAGRGGGRTILRGSGGRTASASGSEGTTAVRAGSIGLARGSGGAGGGGRRTAWGSGSERGMIGLSTILIRESALLCGRNAFDSASRTINCFGAWVFPCRIASTVASSSAACSDFTSTPIDWRRKSTSLLPIPICAASSSTRIFPIGARYS